ncbi:hypothetical protein PPERSA_06105 [Pseudocohnilembus persalinus]|uniref:Transmembrane protein n=1 Tax=Pseudocohnilembus persalinus TaxID=266149 RepID=A0A0V0QV76_PSEPJ|nr:hypothetical protein PPERSA_06105 [Pseudocohnilembus persalinus]|eukprot:KRX06223.1 hypothetical protein PPERSA_06105 [Pseudocohnilembus persalinus]
MGACNAKDHSKDIEENISPSTKNPNQISKQPLKIQQKQQKQEIKMKQEQNSQQQNINKESDNQQQMKQNCNNSNISFDNSNSNQYQYVKTKNISEIQERNMESEIDDGGLKISQVIQEIRDEQNFFLNLDENHKIYKQYKEQLQSQNCNYKQNNKIQYINENHNIKQMHINFQQSKIYETILQQKQLLKNEDTEKKAQLLNMSYANNFEESQQKVVKKKKKRTLPKFKLEELTESLLQIQDGNYEKKNKILVKEESKDEFDVQQDKMLQLLIELRKQLQLKNDPQKNAETINARLQYQNLMEKANKSLSQMNEILRNQSKNKKQKEIENKQNLYEELKTQLKEISQLDIEGINTQQGLEQIKNTKTFGDQNAIEIEMMDITERELKAPIYDIEQSEETKQMEQEAIERWKQNNQKQYRSPSKFCIDIILILLLVGLGVTAYYYFS